MDKDWPLHRIASVYGRTTPISWLSARFACGGALNRKQVTLNIPFNPTPGVTPLLTAPEESHSKNLASLTILKPFDSCHRQV
ncbi:hypothetical protein J6590_007043 [Homalodisca vitripennis]|nr:hypothetical protein J6590_007043 [Homalodisca vitripennis]